jgi:uncharacterized protein YebE (UPF0316 family)
MPTTDVGDPLSVAAYAAGVGIGVLAGLVAGERLTPGTLGVTITTTVPDAAAGMWARGWPAIASAGRDLNGPVTVPFVPIDRRQEARLYQDVARLAPGAGWSSGELRQRPGQLAPAGQPAAGAAPGGDGRTGRGAGPGRLAVAAGKARVSSSG